MILPFKKIPQLLTAATMLLAFTACDSQYAQPNVAAAATSADSKSTDDKPLNQRKDYVADLAQLNNSGASGTAHLMLDGDMLTVNIEASNMTPEQVHPQHIHGFMENNRNGVCPPPSADTNGDGLISVAEGMPFYGAILLPLTPFPKADAAGHISYKRTFKIDKSLLPLQNRVIVLHGLVANGSYMATIPAACGQLKSAGNGKK